MSDDRERSIVALVELASRSAKRDARLASLIGGSAAACSGAIMLALGAPVFVTIAAIYSVAFCAGWAAAHWIGKRR